MANSKPLSAFHFFHKWGAWEDHGELTITATVDGLGLPLRESDTVLRGRRLYIVQKRHCEVCNKIKTRRVQL